MDELRIIDEYIATLQEKYRTGEAKEHTYRPALEKLIQDLLPNITAVNEPKRQKIGAPDFVFLKKDIKIGYLEAKDVDINLDEVAKSEQMQRYASLENLILTDYLEFRFYNGSECYAKVRLGHLGILGDADQIEPIRRNYDQFISLLKDFSITRKQTIKSASELSKRMANLARYARSVFLTALESDEKQTSLHEQFGEFKKELIHDLTYEHFSDLYAQTIAYGFFAARYNDSSLDTFSREEAVFLIPKSNQFLRKLFNYIAGPEIDQRIVWIVDELADLFNYANVRGILEKFNDDSKRNDPVIHFYETFLAAYDPKMRKSRGVYYTPEPVVKFIVNAVDEILKTEFGLNEGLADTSKIEVKIKKNDKVSKQTVHRVQVLDPATGTGTFLNEVIKKIYSRFEGQTGIWEKYVENDLLPRVHGFELLMASYAMCHLKLGITLAETGFDLNKSNKRLGVYLTNTLEEPKEYDDRLELFDPVGITRESIEANNVKTNTPVMVVIGNPPYSGHSNNNNIKFIDDLLKDYKQEPGGGRLQERNPKWLNDDYVKFIRYGQNMIEKNGEGILAFINNHSFLDNPTFRGMRYELLKTFDKIYILDLHGNSKKKEISPDSSKDENVFDIQQGVSINLFIKTNKKKLNKLAEVLHYDQFGKRQIKYDFLNNKRNSEIEYSQLEFIKPQYFFVNKDFNLLSEYEKGIKINELFTLNSVGIVTGKDSLFISQTKDQLLQNISDYYTSGNIKFIHPITYRPFDNQFIYYDTKLIGRARKSVMENFTKGSNLGIITARSNKTQRVDHIFVSKYVSEAKTGESTTQSAIFPLYLYENQIAEQSKHPNFSLQIISKIESYLDLKLFSSFKEIDEKSGEFCPEDLLDYIYAVLHSPSYREKYKEFLKIDFPRVPYPEDQEKFWKLVRLGREIRLLHLLESPKLNQLITKYPINGSNVVEKPYFELTDSGKQLGRVFINQTQYFEDVPKIAWEFYIGGYQPAQKWLKDRKGRELNFEDILHYQKMIIAMFETNKLMKDIDTIDI